MGDSSVSGRPWWRQVSQEPMSPMSWYRGSQLTPTSVGRTSRPGGDRADVGEQVVVGEQDALGLAGAARGVLDEGRVAAAALRAGHRRSRGRELVGGHHVGERPHRGPQEADHGPRSRDRHEQAHAGVGQDGGLPGGVLLEPVEADGGIDRNRDRAGEQDAEEGAQEVEARRQHQGDGVSPRDAALAQPARDGRRLVAEPAVGDRHSLSDAAARGRRLPRPVLAMRSRRAGRRGRGQGRGARGATGTRAAC